MSPRDRSARSKKSQPPIRARSAKKPVRASGAPPATGPRVSLDDVVRAVGLDAATTAALRRAALKRPQDLFTAAGTKALHDLRLTPDAVRRLVAAAKFAAVSNDASIGARLVGYGLTSFGRVARIPLAALEARLGVKSGGERRALRTLHRTAAVVRNATLHRTIVERREKAFDANWYGGGSGKKDAAGKQGDCIECDCCDNVFSPRSYLFDLLNLIYDTWGTPTDAVPDQNYWGLPVDVLEKVIGLDILSLSCTDGNMPIPQVRLADEVLERYLGDTIPLKDETWSRTYTSSFLALLDTSVKLDDRFDPGRFVIATTDSFHAADPKWEILPERWRSERIVRLVFEPRPSLTHIDRLGKWLRRIQAAQAVSDNGRGQPFTDRLDATISAVLAAYRERLIAPTVESVDQLERKLFIDLHAGPCQVTTRITQIIASLQAFILAIRTGDILQIRRDDIALLLEPQALTEVPIEEYGWHWLHDYETWAAAMYALVYTENVLSPPIARPAFRPFISDLTTRATSRTVRQKFFEFLIPSGASLTNPPASSIGQAELASLQEGDPTRDLSQFIDAVKSAQHRYVMVLSEETSVPLSTDRIERDLLFPLLAGWALNRAGEYAAAHDWYRRLYDPLRLGEAGRQVFPFDLVFGQGSDYVARGSVEDPLDPLAIAQDRGGVYLRHSILAMVRNLVDGADHEYTLATPESLDRARELYQLARRVLRAPALGGECFRALVTLERDIVRDVQKTFEASQAGVIPGVRRSIRALRSVRNRNVLGEAERAVRAAASAVPGDRLAGAIDEIVVRALARDASTRGAGPRLGDDLAGGRQSFEGREDDLLTGRHGDGIPDEGTLLDDPSGFRPGGGVTPGLPGEDPWWVSWTRDHPIDDRGIPDASAPGTVGPPSGEFVYHAIPMDASACIPANPALKALASHIDLSLNKLRRCLSITGEPLPRRMFSCGTTSDYMVTLAGQAQSALDQRRTFQFPTEPPRYRYGYLVEKARQYEDVAGRLGGLLRQAIEKRDDEAYRTLLAEQAAGLAQATVTLKQLTVREALDGQNVADLQLNRADIQRTFWDNRIADGWISDREQRALNLMYTSAILQGAAAAVYGSMAIPAALAAAAGGTATVVGGGAAVVSGLGTIASGGTGVVIGAAGAVGGLAAMAGGTTTATLGALLGGGQYLGSSLQAAAGALSTYASAESMMAGFERRWEDWQLYDATAGADYDIARAQVSVAEDRVAITEQDAEVASLSYAHARQVLSFLTTKFTDTELYDWMIGVLLEQYRTVMQIATATAQLAQSALEFERQQTIRIIAGDYWNVDTAAASSGALSNDQKSYGLLGAERLLTDLTKLDAYKLATERRSLQLSKTISLARTMPTELLELREHGTVTFDTLLDWFDQDFPGQYLRLIKSVRVTVVALVPPVDGIHAMLRNAGESSVVVLEDGEFVQKRSMRTFGESVALDSPYNDSGLFALDYNDPMFLPFEGLGVETRWTLELPRASNPFSFDTLADVLITIEYTAIESPEYRTKVLERLGEEITSEAIVDVRAVFPDAWYHLKNESHPDGGHELALTLPRRFFAPNYLSDDTLHTWHVTLVLTGPLGEHWDRVRDGLSIWKGSLTLGAGGVPFATCTGGTGSVDDPNLIVLSTRQDSTQPDPAARLPAETDPTGVWTLALGPDLYTVPDSDGKTGVERLQNIVVVLTVRGRVRRLQP